MKRFTYLAAFIFLVTGNLSAQTIQWAEIQDVCPPAMWTGVLDPVIATDGQNLITAGSIADTISFNGQIFAGADYKNSYLAKHNPSGALLWARHLVGASEIAITTDANKNIFVAGRFTDSLHIGNLIFNSGSNEDGTFIAKFNLQGGLVWVRNAGSGPRPVGLKMTITTDGNGNVYAAGPYNQTFTTGSTTFNAQPGTDVFLVKYDTNGTFQWARTAGTPANDIYPALVGGVTSDVYLAHIARSNSGAQGYFLRKFDASGSQQWEKFANRPGSYFNLPVYLTRDAAENLYMAAHITSPVQFGNLSVNVPTGKNSDAFLAKIDPSGNYIWARQLIGASANTLFNGMECQPKNEITVTKMSSSPSPMINDFIFEKLDTAGNPFQTTPIRNTPNSPFVFGSHRLFVSRSVTDNFGNTYLSGQVAGAINIGGVKLDAPPPVLGMSPEPSATFIAKLQGNPTGLKEALPAFKLNVYPNPAKNHVTVAADLKKATPATVRLINLLGQTITQVTLPADQQIHYKLPLNNLPKGVYIIQLETEAGRPTQRLVIQ